MIFIERIAARRPGWRGLHRPIIFALLLAATALCGCVHYDMTLTNGGRVTNVRKPTYNAEGGYWTYVTADGKHITLPASRVVSVVPHGDKKGFKPEQP
jgi:hypothetical protein